MQQPAAGDAVRRVDATLGAFWNVEGVELRQRRQRPWIPVDRLGVPDYDELVLVANSDKLEDRSDDLRLFISALARGPRGAPRPAPPPTAALLEANKDLSRRFAAAELQRTLPAAAEGRQATLRLHGPKESQRRRSSSPTAA